MNALFLSQLKNMQWMYNDLIIDVDGEALTVATLIERYKELKSALVDIESMTKPTAKPTAKPSTKTKSKTSTKVKTEK